jgi:MinD-like ATPase involved in chromosome partitioning or flagellar assembly
MLLSLWSPKGGSGTSVFAAACAIVLAAERGARLVDLDGDQAAVLGLAPHRPETARGVRDWLAAGPAAPADGLMRLAINAGPGLELIPPGPADRASSGEAGAALGVVLREWGSAIVVDCGRADDAAARAVVEVSDHSVVVLRPCYLALRRAAADELARAASGVVVVEEAGRALGAREVADVLGVPVLATAPVRATIARVVDAGVLASRRPDQLARPARTLLERLGVARSRDTAA